MKATSLIWELKMVGCKGKSPEELFIDRSTEETRSIYTLIENEIIQFDRGRRVFLLRADVAKITLLQILELESFYDLSDPVLRFTLEDITLAEVFNEMGFLTSTTIARQFNKDVESERIWSKIRQRERTRKNNRELTIDH